MVIIAESASGDLVRVKASDLSQEMGVMASPRPPDGR